MLSSAWLGCKAVETLLRVLAVKKGAEAIIALPTGGRVGKQVCYRILGHMLIDALDGICKAQDQTKYQTKIGG